MTPTRLASLVMSRIVPPLKRRRVPQRGPHWCEGTGSRIGESPQIALLLIPNVARWRVSGCVHGDAGRSQLPGQLGGGRSGSSSPYAAARARPGPRSPRSSLSAVSSVPVSSSRRPDRARRCNPRPAPAIQSAVRAGQSERKERTPCRDTSRGTSKRRRLLPKPWLSRHRIPSLRAVVASRWGSVASRYRDFPRCATRPR
jgi:hypothetical protein